MTRLDPDDDDRLWLVLTVIGLVGIGVLWLWLGL